MNWYRQNRWLGNFLIAFAAALLLAVWFLFHARGAFAATLAEFNSASSERSRLEHLNPFPKEENFRKTQSALDQYGAALNKIKDELRAQVIPMTPLAPNEFQTRLRQTIASTAERARANRVKLPNNFHLGFDEFTTTLPSTGAAPLLGQELAQVELVVRFLIEAHVDAITAVKRVPASPIETGAPAAAAKRPLAAGNAAPPVVERSIVDLTFNAAPSALRKVLNQIASSEHQFFVVRTLSVRNEQVKGPSREATNASTGKAAETAGTTGSGALKFIVGNEHVETTARVEMVRFAF